MSSEIPLWEPAQERINNSSMKKFAGFVNNKTGSSFSSYDELYKWSVENINSFWDLLLNFSGIRYSSPYDQIRIEPDSNTMFGHKWFPGMKLNFAENLLSRNDDKTAIIYQCENREKIYLSYKELKGFVSKCAASLKNAGVRPGDRVAAYISNGPEAIIAMLAATSIGAVWSSTSPDFGSQGALDRFSQIKPRILFAVNGYIYNGREFDKTETIKQLKQNLPDTKKFVIIEKIPIKTEQDENTVLWNEFLDIDTENVVFEQLPFDHPVYIMYSSGTTGKPKCIVHGAGGTLLQHYKELVLHTNLGSNDTIMYFTTCGWMMWNWLVSSLITGATVFLYDGSPGWPDLNTIWKSVHEEKINILGTSPKFLSACEKNGIFPKDSFDLSSLKTILSTGAPLSGDNFNWVYENVKKDIQLSSISGGTDIISCFMLGNPMLPVYSEEIQCRGLGMKVESYDEMAQPRINQKGELVCTAPFPSMPVSFWDDHDNKKYFSAYFEYFPGVWRHGDFIRITERGGVVVYGRSDSTLNPGGVRIGTAEIYRVIESFDEVANSLVVGPKSGNDIMIVLFVVLKKGIVLTGELVEKFRTAIKSGLTPRHLPRHIVQIEEVPETLNGKKVEIAVTKILNGEDVTNRSALANPDSLDQFINMNLLT